MRFFDKIGFLVFSALFGAVNAFALTPADNVDLSQKLEDVQSGLDTASNKGLGIASIILAVVGLVAFSYGVYETFIDEDSRQEGKKVKGVLKMIGGVIIAFSAYIFKKAIE